MAIFSDSGSLMEVGTTYKNPVTNTYMGNTQITAQNPGGGGFFSGVSDWFSGVGQSLENLVKTGATIYSNVEDLKLARDIQRTRNDAILEQYRNAPQEVQVTAPSTADAVKDQQGYASQLAGSLGLGAVAGQGSNLLLLGGLAFLVWQMGK